MRGFQNNKSYIFNKKILNFKLLNISNYPNLY